MKILQENGIDSGRYISVHKLNSEQFISLLSLYTSMNCRGEISYPVFLPVIFDHNPWEFRGYLGDF